MDGGDGSTPDDALSGVPEQMRSAVLNVHLRECGTLASDLWHSHKEQQQDYATVAQLYRLSHPECTFDDYDAAACYCRELYKSRP